MSNFAIAMEPTPLVRFLIPLHGGAGAEMGAVERRVDELLAGFHDSLAITYREAVLAEAFRTFADEWRRATRFQSSLDRITNHPAYRAVVELGEDVIPLVLGELETRPEPWFAALREIAKVDPVKPEDRGNMRAMADAWIRWGRDRGLIR